MNTDSIVAVQPSAQGRDNANPAASETAAAAGHSQQTKTRCCCASCGTFTRAVAKVQFFDTLIQSGISADDLYERVTKFWLLLAFIGAFFAAISHVGLVEKPRLATGAEPRPDLEGLYALAFYLSFLVNVGAMFCASALMLFVVSIPRETVKKALKKVILLISLPAHFIAMGFLATNIAMVLLMRTTYSDSDLGLAVATIGCLVAFAIVVLGSIYLTLARPTVVTAGDQTDEEASFSGVSIFSRCISLLTFSMLYYRMLKSGLTEREVRTRFVHFWTSISIVAVVLGGTGFDGLWLRPTELAQEVNNWALTAYPVSMWLTVSLNMYAALTASVLLIFELMSGGDTGATFRFVRKVYSWASLPMILSVFGFVAFLSGLTFLVQATYSTMPRVFRTVLMFCVFVCVSTTIVIILRFASKPLGEQLDGVQLPKMRTGVARLTNYLTLRRKYYRVLGSGLTEEQVYNRISEGWSSVSINAALLTYISFILLQTFGYPENRTQELTKTSNLFGMLMSITLMFLTMSVVISLLFLSLMISVEQGKLIRWLSSRASMIFIPTFFLGLGITGLLTCVCLLMRVFYSDYTFTISLIGVAGFALLASVTRALSARSIPKEDMSDDKLHSIIDDVKYTKMSFLSFFTHGHLFASLNASGIEERDAFHRLQGLFDGIGIVGGLLAVIGADSLNELPDDTDDELNWYGISAVGAFGFNLSALIMAAWYSSVISMIPRGSVRLFLHKMRHGLFLPAYLLMFGLFCSFVNYLEMSVLKYEDLEIRWVFRGIIGFFGLILIVTYTYVILMATYMIRKCRKKGRFAEAEHGKSVRRKTKVKEHGCCSSIWHGWSKTLTSSKFSSAQTYQRLENVWMSQGVVSGVFAAVAFLAVQEGFLKDDKNAFLVVYITGCFFALCATTAATVLNILFLIVMAMLPNPAVKDYVKALSPFIPLPNVILVLGAIAFVAVTPWLVRNLYSQALFKLFGFISWGAIFVCLVMLCASQIFRPLLAKRLHRQHQAEERATLERTSQDAPPAKAESVVSSSATSSSPAC